MMDSTVQVKKWGVVCALMAAAFQTQGQELVEPYHTPEERRAVAGLELNGMSIGALLEVEGSVGNESGEDVSDIVLATVELGLETTLHEWAAGRVLLLWEEDDTEPIALDEAAIVLGGIEGVPWSLEVGKLYVPFGAFHSHFISDPLVLELGETRQSAAILGYAWGILHMKAGVFNGSVNDDTEDEVNEFLAAFMLTPAEGNELGVYWISNLGESDGLSEGLSGAIESSEEEAGLSYDRVGGAGAYFHSELGRFILEAEYLAALDSFDAGLLGEGALQPRTWNTELAYTVSDDLELAVRYEGSDEYPDMPEAQYGVATSYALAEKVTLGIEYLHGTFDGDVDDRDVVTCQIAVEL